MDDNDWDLRAVVRGCSATAVDPPDPFSSFPSPLPQKGGTGEFFGFPDPMETPTARHQLEEHCKSCIKPHHQRQLQPPPPVPKPSYPSCSPAASVFPAFATAPHQFQQQPRQPHPPVSRNPLRSKRRKNQHKKVVCQVPADGISPDMWAWRKYGQKPIKGSPYPSRGYYRCSSSKGCQARKQVERSRAEPGMLVITYTAEHDHPVPTHRNSLSGSTRQKLPHPSSAAQPPLASSGCRGDGENPLSPGSHPSSSPLSSPAAAAPRANSVENELFPRGRPRILKHSEEEEEEDELTVGDVEMMGEDDMLFLGMEVIDGSTTSTGTTKSPGRVSVSSAFFADDGGFEEYFFQSTWLANSNAAAAAGGGS
ncbi:unnamed protein product [Musa acuminata subsp. malaccensis]|uniref:(wild Malaysian banana) hypothetical protein n=1 Tax=Musa acuminata subsp. malaccensis TaxID=214687 RepID=A0A8D7EZE7_MUSAM|nr:unnamed protein product [Musa acuminata subsp. malaccensis]